MALLVLIMVFLSGFTGLIYQITWQKYLSIYLGSHALSTSLTLASFFLFLSLGYSLAGRLGHRLHPNKILSYAYIEGAIGLYAIFSPKLFSLLYEVWPSYPSNNPMHFFSSLLFAFALMGLPTLLMGATIPLLTQGLSQRLSQGHIIHSWVYGINTGGAFLGTLLAGFYLLEVYGLEQSLNLTGMINALICVFLIIYCKVFSLSFEGFQPNFDSPRKLQVNSFLLLSLLSGFVSFGLESLIIRMTGITLGNSNYTYTVVVACFILSIALGSAFAAFSRDETGRRWLIFNQFFLLLSLVALYLVIPQWPMIFSTVKLFFARSEINFAPYLTLNFITQFTILVMPVSLMGMTIPLLFQQLKNSDQYLSETAGQMYSYNAFGATLGSLLLGYAAFFFLRADQVFLILILLVGLCLTIVLIKLSSGSLFFKISPLFLTLSCLFILPHWEDTSFIPSRVITLAKAPQTRAAYKNLIEKIDDHSGKKVLFSDYGPNTYTVTLERASKERVVFVNGKPDASTDGDSFTRTLTALIPLTLATKNEDIFIIGLGSGLSTGIASSFQGTKRVKVTEIASGVIQSLPYFEKWNFDLKSNQDKVEIVNDDAYKVLKNESETYDLIFSEPSNTWVAGVEKIYTEEFLTQVSKKLRPHGIYSQWFPFFAVSEDSFLSVVHNFKKAFQYVTLWTAGGSATMIIASHQPLSIPNLKQKMEANKKIYQSIQKASAEEILYHQVWTNNAIAELASKARIPHSVYQPTLAYQSGRAYFLSSVLDYETLAKKYFVKRSHSQETQGAVASSDPLLWQTIADQLPKEFYLKAQSYLAKVDPFLVSKISLAREKRFPEDLKKRFNKQRLATRHKYDQYTYLQSKESSKAPSLTDPNGYLATELFNRFLFLKSLREGVHLEKVTRHLPKKCDGLEACSATKVEVLRFLDPTINKQLIKLTKNYENKVEGVEEEIDTLFEDYRTKL